MPLRKIYSTRTRALQTRSEEQHLKIFVLGKFFRIDVPKDMRNANKHLLTVEYGKCPREMEYIFIALGLGFTNHSDTSDEDDRLSFFLKRSMRSSLPGLSTINKTHKNEHH